MEVTSILPYLLMNGQEWIPETMIYMRYEHCPISVYGKRAWKAGTDFPFWGKENGEENMVYFDHIWLQIVRGEGSNSGWCMSRNIALEVTSSTSLANKHPGRRDVNKNPLFEMKR